MKNGLADFFASHNKVAIAFSGGVDSAYLLYAAINYGAQVKAFYVKSQFQPAFELEDAKRLAKELCADMEILPLDILQQDAIKSNPEDRCYHCKKLIMERILTEIRVQGYDELLDGTNASDDFSDRPGMRVLSELKIYSPLRMCGVTKEEVRRLSREAGLFTWDKPAYACLATRIPTGTAISEEILHNTELAEEYLYKLGFRDFRVRYADGEAKIQLRENDFSRYEAEQNVIARELGKYYKEVVLDCRPRM